MNTTLGDFIVILLLAALSQCKRRWKRCRSDFLYNWNNNNNNDNNNNNRTNKSERRKKGKRAGGKEKINTSGFCLYVRAEKLLQFSL